MNAFEKIKRGLEQARAFARGECEHEWVDEDRRDGRKRHCPKCGVSLYEPTQ